MSKKNLYWTRRPRIETLIFPKASEPLKKQLACPAIEAISCPSDFRHAKMSTEKRCGTPQVPSQKCKNSELKIELRHQRSIFA
jgi:hypothetical protein